MVSRQEVNLTKGMGGGQALQVIDSTGKGQEGRGSKEEAAQPGKGTGNHAERLDFIKSRNPFVQGPPAWPHLCSGLALC